MGANGKDEEESLASSVVSGSPHRIHIPIGSIDISVQITAWLGQCP